PYPLLLHYLPVVLQIIYCIATIAIARYIKHNVCYIYLLCDFEMCNGLFEYPRTRVRSDAQVNCSGVVLWSGDGLDSLDCLADVHVCQNGVAAGALGSALICFGGL